ncbi:MAG: ChbG/HpnK family deacetylase [Clostridia bacterium]|nr:ChbG/HpnK family deacetylase [Clostridia bacterium]
MIINADDFGYSNENNMAIAECFRQGTINRTTIMVNMPSAQQARDLAFEQGFEKAVGLHINLTEGKALSPECAASDLCDENGVFRGEFHIPFKARLYLSKAIRRAIASETEAQVKRYLDMGFTLMHADSHNYTHSYISVWSSVAPVLKKYGFRSVRISRNIPFGSFSPLFAVYKGIFNPMIKNFKTTAGKVSTTAYFGSVQDFEATTDKASIRDDIELMTHPVYIDGVLTDNTLPNPHPMVSADWLRDNGLVPDNIAHRKIQLLVTFIQVHIGGAMTSLVNFLNSIDCDKYDVDVVFYETDGSRWGIKDEINILPQGKQHESYSVSNILSKVASPSYMIARLRDIYYKKVKHNKRRAVQIMAKQGCRYSPGLTKEYDIAIAYEYTWPLNYVATKVNARKKIAWHHLDFETSGLVFKDDKKAFDAVDRMVFVSENCMAKFTGDHPEYKDKSLFIPNILTTDYVRKKGEEPCELPFEDSDDLIKFVTVARISFEHKGLDRGVEAFRRLRDDGLLHNVRWTIIGKGRDYEKLCSMIEEYGLGDYIFPIGVRENPIPYMKKHNAMLLPSRHEANQWW